MPSKIRYLVMNETDALLNAREAGIFLGYNPITASLVTWEALVAWADTVGYGRRIVKFRDKAHYRDSRRTWLSVLARLKENKAVAPKPKKKQPREPVTIFNNNYTSYVTYVDQHGEPIGVESVRQQQPNEPTGRSVSGQPTEGFAESFFGRGLGGLGGGL